MRKIATILFHCLFLMLFISGCKKNDKPELPKDNLSGDVEHFYNLPDDAMPELNEILEKVKISDNRTSFLSNYLAKAGKPIWKNVITNKSTNPDTIVFLIPFLSKHGDITNYWVCKKVGKDYTFKAFNKGALSNIQPTENFPNSLLKAYLTIFGVFEKEVNNRDSTFIGGNFKMFISNAKLTFGGNINNSQRLSSDPTSYTMTCYQVSCFGKGSSLTTLPSCWDCNTIWHYSDGYYNDPSQMGVDPYGGGGGSPSGGGGYNPYDANGNLIERVELLDYLLSIKPDMLIPCDFWPQFQSLASFQVPQTVMDRLNALNSSYTPISIEPFDFPVQVFGTVDNFEIQHIKDAAGSIVNCDYFPIHITQMPKKADNTEMTPGELFELFRKDIDSFIDTDFAKFKPYDDGITDDTQLWQSTNPLTSMLYLDMAEDGVVITSDYYNSGNSASFTVNTLRTALAFNHPLGGVRKWGIMPDPVNNGYTFYTTAVDRIYREYVAIVDKVIEETDLIPSGFEQADKLWRSMQDKMILYIQQNGGAASKYTTSEIVARPKWHDIKAFFEGSLSLDQLMDRMGC